MKADGEFYHWHRLAQYLLEPQDVVRVIEPTLADALHERSSLGKARGWLMRSHVALFAAIVAVLVGNVWSRLRQANWLSYLLLVLAGLSGAAVLRHGDTQRFALAHVLYLGVAVGIGTTVVGIPRNLLRHMGTVTMVVCFAGLAACPWWGEVCAGQRQWLKFGSLQIQVAIFALPAFVAFVARCTEAKWYGWLSLGVAITLLLVILENNVEATVVYAATALAAQLRLRGKLLSWLCTSVLVASASIAVVSAPHGDFWSWAGTAALVLAIVHATRMGSQGAYRAIRQSLLAALVSLTALRGFGDDSLPIVGFGGSAIVAFFVLIAMQMRNEGLTSAA